MALVAKGLVKLTEEMGELQQVVGKKLAYYHTDEHPDGQGSLKERMEDEMGDVLAAIAFVKGAFSLDDQRIQERQQAKLKLFEKWHNEID